MNESDLASFIAKYAKPYDPDKDEYDRSSYAAPIKAGKNTAIYNAHSYHTKVPHQGIVPYIEHYTSPGDLVLDPFCGSGMTGVAALMAGREVILNDLSPAAAHIAYNYCTPVDVVALKHEYERIQTAVQDEFEWLYGTSCDRCGGPAIIQNTIWSDVFECGRCGSSIILWERAFSRDTQQLSAQFTCPSCGKEWRKAQLRRIGVYPVLTGYECRGKCKPKRCEHPLTEQELRLIDEIDQKPVPYWYPKVPLDPNSEMYIRGALHLRNIQTVDQLYTKRNLWAMARLWHEIDGVSDPIIKKRLESSFTAICQLVSRMRRYRAGGFGGNIMSGLIYLPSLNLDVNVLKLWRTKFRDIFDAAVQTKGFNPDSCVANIGSATNLGDIPDQTVDYVFTDPPFGMNLYYSDLNLIWESWLGKFTNATFEAVVHREQKIGAKSVADYLALMTASFREIYRVLKPARWASVVFHNSDDKIWQTILDATQTAGLELVEINSFDKEQLSFKGVRGSKGLERVTNKDIVLNLRKPSESNYPRIADVPNTTQNQSSETDQSGIQQQTINPDRGPTQQANGDTEIRVVEQIAEYLSQDPMPQDRSLQALWNTALGEMIRSGAVDASMDEVGRMLPHYFKEVDGRWYLRGETVMGGNVFDLRADADAIAWLAQTLQEPKTIGDLIPQWQMLTAQSKSFTPGRLERLLEQNFWLDKRTGRWRIPSTQEREKMSARSDLKGEALLRTVRRYLAGQLPQMPMPMELALWVRECYKREAYEEASGLFNNLDASQIDQGLYRELKRIVAVCQSRLRTNAATDGGNRDVGSIDI